MNLRTDQSSTEQFSSEQCSIVNYCSMQICTVMFNTENMSPVKYCAEQLSEDNQFHLCGRNEEMMTVLPAWNTDL